MVRGRALWQRGGMLLDFLPRCLVFVLAGFLALPLPAAQGVFSSDGRELFLNVTGEAGSLKAITLATKSDRLIDLTSVVGPGRVNGLARARNGQLLVVTPQALFACTPGGRGQRVTGFPPRFVAADVACHEASGDIVVSGAFTRPDDPNRVERDALLLLRRDAPEPSEIQTAGLTRLQAPVFDRDGWLHFAGDDDLWVGRVVRSEVNGKPGAILEAYRHAPLAGREVRESSEAQIVSALALLGDKVCVELTSASGNTLVRLPRARPTLAKDGRLADFLSSAKPRWALHARVLGAAENLGPLARSAGLCATADESTIAFQTAGPSLRRWNLLSIKDARPRELLTESD